MNRKLLGIGVGLKAAAKAFTEDRPHYQVGTQRIVCPICGHDEFNQRSMLMNTIGMTMMNMDWLNDSACVLICRRCTRMELFAKAPANE
jgi:predicted nucleic-acid-binding Zn-ribbon protein